MYRQLKGTPGLFYLLVIMERNSEPKQNFGLPSIGIPFEILFNEDLTNTEKILYGFVRNLAHSEKGCHASNEYLCDLMGLNQVRTISNGIKNLSDCGAIHITHNTINRKKVRVIDINHEYWKIFSKKVGVVGWNKFSKMEKIFPKFGKKVLGSSYNDSYSIEEESEKGKKEKNGGRLQNARRIILQLLPEEWQSSGEFIEALDDWLSSRKEKGNTPTETAAKRTGKQLAKYSLEISTEALSKSADNGYTGVFPKDVQTPGRKRTKQNTSSKTPQELFEAEGFNPGYVKKFLRYYQKAESLLLKPTPVDKETLAENMLVLRAYIRENQTDRASKNMTVPTGGEMVEHFTNWLQEQDWVKDVTADTFKFDSGLFQKFLRELSRELQVDILRGFAIYQ